MPATIIHPKDVSALGLIAQRPAKSGSRALVNGLSPKAKALGRALTGRPPQRGTSRNIVGTVTYLYEWAGGGADRPSVSNGTKGRGQARSSIKKKIAKRKRK